MNAVTPIPRIPRGLRLLCGAAIVAETAYEMGLSVADLVGPSREKRFVRGRMAVAWIARNGGKLSYPEIARVIGRDTETMRYTLPRADELRERDPAFRALTDKVLDWMRQEIAA